MIRSTLNGEVSSASTCRWHAGFLAPLSLSINRVVSSDDIDSRREIVSNARSYIIVTTFYKVYFVIEKMTYLCDLK